MDANWLSDFANNLLQLKVAMMYRKSKLIDSEKRLMIARDARWREVGKMGVKRVKKYKLSVIN